MKTDEEPINDTPAKPPIAWKRVAIAVVADIAALVVFVAAGRSSHDEGNSVSGIIEVAGPFLIGATVGWLLARAWREPFEWRPAGAKIWISTLALGMVLRKGGLSGGERGAATSFVIVAIIVTGVLMLGWRVIATWLTNRRTTVL